MTLSTTVWSVITIMRTRLMLQKKLKTTRLVSITMRLSQQVGQKPYEETHVRVDGCEDQYKR
jgi:hypothetical protein